MSLRLFRTAVVSSALLAAPALLAQDTTLAGWTFSQFLGEGPPTISGETFETVGSVVATYRGSTIPDSNLVDGVIVGNIGGPGHDDPSIGSWSFSNFDINGGIEVRADSLGGLLNTTNARTADGVDMHLSDSQGLMLTFNLTGTLWSIQVNDTDGYANAAGPDFSFAARGNGGPATVEWLFNGSVFATSTIAAGPHFAIYAHELPSAFYGDGSIEGRLVSGSVSFDNVQFNGQLGAAPEFSEQPQSLLRLVGESANFTVAVTGATTPTFQWYKDEVAIPSATSCSYSLPRVTLSDAGRYRVTVRSANGVAADSAAAVLTVHQAPQFTRQPAARSANPGQTVTFSIEATGTPAPIFRWQRDGADLIDGGNVAGASSATLTLTEVTEADEGAYRVFVSNAVASIASAAAALTITDLDIAPAVTSAPHDVVSVVGGTATFSVVATGAPEPTYPWMRDGEPLADGPGIQGSTTSELVLSDLTAARSGRYTVVITNAAGVAELDAELVVHTPPAIVSGPGPESRAIAAGSSVTFEVVASGDPEPAYQWLHDGVELTGETNATLVLGPVASAHAGDYTVRVTNAAGSTTSPVSALVVGTGASITTQPSGALVAVGGETTLHVEAVGDPEPEFQWLRNGEEIPDATDAALTLSNIGPDQTGTYTVRVSNLFATVVSAPAVVRIAHAVQTESPKRPQRFDPGSTLVIGTAPGGDTGELRYEWSLNGKPIPGAHGPALEIDAATAADSGVYRLKVYNAAGRLAASRVVARIAVTIANTYDALLRDPETGKPVGRVELKLTDRGAFTGKVIYLEKRAQAVRGKLQLASDDSTGTAVATVKRKRGLPALELDLELDARAAALELGLSLAGEIDPLAVAVASPRTTAVTWAGNYTLALAPVAENPALEAVDLAARIDPRGALRLTGRLADGAKLTGKFPASIDGVHAIFASPYRGEGHLAGSLALYEVNGYANADESSSGRFAWFKPANAKDKFSPTGIDAELSPSLTPRP